MQLPTFDLSMVVRRLKKEAMTKGWSKERVEKALHEYRQYLALCKATPGIAHTPTRDADEVWHAHILFTREYVRDCMAYFGHYFHHMPKDEKEQGIKCCGALDMTDEPEQKDKGPDEACGNCYQGNVNDERRPAEEAGPFMETKPGCDGRCCAACKGDIRHLPLMEALYGELEARQGAYERFRPETMQVTDR